MRRISASVIALAVIAAIFIAGEAYAYLPQDRGFSSSVDVNDTIDYSMGAKGAYVGSAALLDNGDLLPVKELYIYRDPSYRSDVDEENITAVGSQVFTQDYYIDQLTKNLRFRGFSNITILNAAELKDKLVSDMPAVSQKGLVILSGAIPDTVFGTSSTVLEDWIEAGGYLYWAGNIIGRTMSTTNDIIVVDKQIDMIGVDSFCEKVPAASLDTEYRSKLCFENQELEFAPDVTSLTTGIMKTGISDDGTHYTVSLIKKGNGQIGIFSGQFNSQQIHDMAISIASGLIYKTQIVDFRESEFNRSLSGSFEKPTVHGNLSVYISVGKYHCAYADRFDITV